MRADSDQTSQLAFIQELRDSNLQRLQRIADLVILPRKESKDICNRLKELQERDDFNQV